MQFCERNFITITSKSLPLRAGKDELRYLDAKHQLCSASVFFFHVNRPLETELRIDALWKYFRIEPFQCWSFPPDHLLEPGSVSLWFPGVIIPCQVTKVSVAEPYIWNLNACHGEVVSSTALTYRKVPTTTQLKLPVPEKLPEHMPIIWNVFYILSIKNIKIIWNYIGISSTFLMYWQNNLLNVRIFSMLIQNDNNG